MFKKNQYIMVLILCSLFSSILLASDRYQLPSGETILDPTKPEQWQAPQSTKTKAKKQVSFSLSYIRASGEQKLAMINGKKVTEGDQVNGAYVQRIRSDSVVLNYKGQQKELRMNKVQGIQRSGN